MAGVPFPRSKPLAVFISMLKLKITDALLKRFSDISNCLCMCEKKNERNGMMWSGMGVQGGRGERDRNGNFQDGIPLEKYGEIFVT